MIPDAIAATHGRFPLLPDDWRRLGSQLCDGLDADYLLIDVGPTTGEPRYTAISLNSALYTLHLYNDVADIHAPRKEGGLGVKASLFVPLNRDRERHEGHIAALYVENRQFTHRDIDRLKSVTERISALLNTH